MKKLIWLLMLVLFIGTAFAGSIENLQYTDDNMWWKTTKTINDYSVVIDADTLQGHSAGDFFSYSDNSANSVQTYISSRETAWTDTGLSFGSMVNFLTGGNNMNGFSSFIDWLFSIFATRKQLDACHARIDAIEARHYGVSVDDYQMYYASQMAKESQTGAYTYQGWTCTEDGICLS